MAGIFPKQKLTKGQKTTEWWEANADYFIEQASFWSADRWEMIMLYRAAMGIIDPAAYKYVLNPYNSEDENFKNYPAQMRNYDIVIPILNLFTGEKAEKTLTSQVVVVNPDVIDRRTEALNQTFRSTIAQGFVNSLNDAGVQTGVLSQEVPEMNKLQEEFETNWNDDRAIFGQEAIDYLKYHLNLKDKYQEAFWDWLCVGRVYTYKDTYRKDVIHEVVPPIECWHGTTKTGFVEDSNWFVRRTRYNLNDCIDRFRDVLSDEEVSELESKFRHGNEVVSTTFMSMPSVDKVTSSSTNNTYINPQGLIDVWHISWKGFKKVGVLKYINTETGIEDEMEVDEDYKLSPEHGDISIEWGWISIVNEIHRIGEKKYKYAQELEAQRNEISNSSECKLPYNGRLGYTERNKIISVVKQLLPYQALYNIYHFRAELTLARNKDKIMLMPMGLKPTGWAEDKWLYFAETTGIAWFDETKPNASAVLSAIKAIDMGLGNYIQEMRALLKETKEEAWEAIGMNRQRYGDVMASDGKGNNEQAVMKSSVISREMFRRFERFQESDLQGLLDVSKIAWIDGKKGSYINGDGRKAFLNIDGDKYMEADHKIFVLDSEAENAKLQMSKQYAFGLAQKSGSPASLVFEVIDANNMSKLKNISMKFEKVQKEMEQQMAQNQQQGAEQLQAMKDKTQQAEIAGKVQVANISANAIIESANIKAHNDTLANVNNDSNIPGLEELDSEYNKYVQAVREHDLKKQSEGLKSFQAAADRRLKESKLELEQENIRIKQEQLQHNKSKKT